MILPTFGMPFGWVRRISIAIVILLGPATLYYLCFNQLPQIIPIRTKIQPTPATSELQQPRPSVKAHHTKVNRPAQTSWTIKPIPEKHWQSWKVNALKLEEKQRELVLTWREVNPGHRYELISDDVIENFVKSSFGNKSDVTDTFLSLTDKISRADLIRYLILYHDGGVYSDIDTKALKPIKNWVPERHAGKVNVVLGLEIDDPDTMWADWADNFCFCQSTMMAASGHRIFEIIIEKIVRRFKETAIEQKTDLAHVNLTFHDVLRTTGPVAFTDAVFQYLSDQMGQQISRSNFSGINVPKRMADVLVLPVVAFVPGQGHSNSGSPEDKGALVHHIGMGSWRDAHSPYKNEKTPEQIKEEEENMKKDEEERQKKEEDEWKKKEEEERKKSGGKEQGKRN